ncbi:MAG: histidine phosphatase family protein, partial [Vitreoscilla sp.]
MDASNRLPAMLWMVRHGQSAGNVARDLAESGGHHLIDIATRDMDVPLSPLGERQSNAVGHWFGRLPPGERPTAVLCSPYLRARQTAERLVDAAGWRDLPIEFDERLREKEFGIVDRLTAAGIRSKYPELAEQRAHVGKFYFRPPGGESWCDVVLRLRGVLDTLGLEYAGERVLVVGHQVIASCLRYLIERLDEASLLALDARGEIPNCAVSSYRFSATAGARGRLVPDLVNFTAPVSDEGTPVTRAPDAAVAP